MPLPVPPRPKEKNHGPEGRAHGQGQKNGLGNPPPELRRFTKDQPELITTAEAGYRISVSRSTIVAWCRAGKLRSVYIGTTMRSGLRVYREDIDAIVDRAKVSRDGI